MKLKSYALIAEIISAIAVVLSLLFVGYQLNQNTNEIRAANRQEATGTAINATLSVSTNPELAAALSKITEGSELSPAETVQYSYFVRGLLYDVQNAYLLYLEGRLDKEYWETRSAIVRTYLQQPLAKQIYNHDMRRGILDARFVLWIEQNAI
jgi:hypothetical protein